MKSLTTTLLIIFALTLAACGAGEIQPLSFGAAAWEDGEVSEYRVTDVNGDYAGTLRFDIVRGAGDNEWHMRREISAQGMLEIISVTLSGSGFRPQAAMQVRTDRDGQELVNTSYNGTRVDLELTTRQDITTYQRVSVPSDVRDETTLLMLLRALPLAQNYATRLNVFTPILGSMERTTVQVVERETVETPAGAFEAWRLHVEGRDRQTRSQIWVAVDAPHPIVKFIDGRNRGTFEITNFERGAP
jgi:hypothetical protein